MSEQVTVSRSWCTYPDHKGPRWMLSVYFYRRTKSWNGIQRYCMTCTNRYVKRFQLSDAAAARRRERSRERKAELRRERGIPVRELRNPTSLYGAGRTLLSPKGEGYTAQQILDWLQPYLSKDQGDGYTVYWLNGVQMVTVDVDLMRHLEKGYQATVSLAVADRLAFTYDLELWWLDNVA